MPSDWGRCPTCKDWDFLGPGHRCKPVFRVWSREHHGADEDGCAVREVDAECAAERWAEEDDAHSADYTIVGGESVTVRVTGPDGAVSWWVVSGEAVPSYTANQREAPDA